MTNNKKRNSYKIVTILIATLLLSMFSNVLAVDNSQLYEVPYIQSTPSASNKGMNIGYSDDSTYRYEYYVSKRAYDTSTAYVTTYLDEQQNLHFVFISNDSSYTNEVFTISTNRITISSGSESFSNTYSNIKYNNTKDGHVYVDKVTGLSMDVSISQYSSFDEAFNSVVNFQEPSTAYSLNYSLPAGNAIVIELGQGSNPYTISTTSINPGPFDGTGLDGKQWGFYNTLPSTIEYPLSGASDIAFRGYGGQSVFGQYMTYSISGDFVLENHTEQYLIIVNPLWAYTSDGNITNSRIDISIDKVTSFKVYPLGTQLVNGGWTSQNEGEYLDGNYDEGTNTWYTTDEDGNVVDSKVGGYNYVDYGPQTVTQWLENIAHQIGGFFTGAIGAITTLVSAIGNIATELLGLYVWLPPAVQGILTSALILAITIGVIKVFI